MHRDYQIVTAENAISLEIKVTQQINQNKRLVPCGGVMFFPDTGKSAQALVEAPSSRFASWFSAVMAMAFVASVIGAAGAFTWWVLVN